MALGLRVVGDDGSPVRFRQALVRALGGLFEIWTYALAPVALITSIVSAKGKRVGDMFAGTYVHAGARCRPGSRCRRYSPPYRRRWRDGRRRWRYPGCPGRRPTRQAATCAGIAELQPAAREALGIQLANAVAAQVSPPPPPGTPPAAYLSAVLAVRRERERASFAASSLQPAGSSVPARGRSVPAARRRAARAARAAGRLPGRAGIRAARLTAAVRSPERQDSR